jgi:hypothetical protein
MMAHPPAKAPALSDTRHELKAVTQAYRLPEVRMWLRLHPACFREAYSARQVNNVYFDTVNLDSFVQNLAGSSARRKVRLRWYGEGCLDVLSTLEVKCKRNRHGWKLSQAIPQALNLYAMTWREILAALRKETPYELWRYLEDGRDPAVLIRYRREYYETFDGRVRVTLDHHISAYDQRHYERPNLVFALPMVDNLVVEFKANSLDGQPLADVVDSLPWRVSKSSKYAQSVSALLGY